MTRYQLFRAARTCGYAFWWLFIAATMVAGGIPWFGSPDQDDAGWIIHGHTLGEPRRYTNYLPSDGFDITPGITSIAFCLLVLAALTEAIAAQRLTAGIITVAVPFVTTALIWAAMPRGHWTFVLEPLPAMFLILLAMAIRETWTRRLAPSMTSA